MVPCVPPGVSPDSMISYKPMDKISPNFGWCSSGYRSTNCILKVQVHSKIKYLSKLLLWVEAYTLTPSPGH